MYWKHLGTYNKNKFGAQTGMDAKPESNPIIKSARCVR